MTASSPPQVPLGAPVCTVSIATESDLTAHGTFADLAPGTVVCIAPGTYGRQFVVAGTHGTADRPITFVVKPAGAVAAFKAGVLLRKVSYVTMTGLDVSQDPKAGPWAAVILDQGTDHTAVSGFNVHDSYVGIAIGSSDGGAGVGNQIVDSRSDRNWNTGIAIGDLSDGSARELNLVARNRVEGNGGHGIEITDANYVAIRGNTVVGNGTGIHSVQQGGYSGIHLYSPGPSGPAAAHGLRCSHNVIESNRAEGTQERPAPQACSDGSGSGHCTDGNGIQVDRFCSSNDVLSNVATGNAGDGISLYGATGNRVVGNRVSGNNQQPGRFMFFPGPAEIAVQAINLPAGSASGNVVRDNVAVTTVHKVPAFYQSANAGPNTIGPNNVWHWSKASEPGWFWGPVYIGTTWYSSAERVNAITGTTGNIVGLPAP